MLQRIFTQFIIPMTIFVQAETDILYLNGRFLYGEINVMFGELDTEISTNEIQEGRRYLLYINEFLH